MDDIGDESLLRSPAWPKGLVLSWTLLGIFKGDEIDATKQCLLCNPDKIREDKLDKCDKDLDENANHCTEDDMMTIGERPGRRCAVCLSLLWNSDSMVVGDYSTAVPRWLKNRLFGILPFLFVFLFLVCGVGTIGWYLYEFWGQLRGVTHLVSFLAYSVILVGVAFVCMASWTMHYFSRLPGKAGHWYNMLHVDYVARRLRCLSGSKLRLPASLFLTFSMVWAVVNVFFQVLNVVQYLISTDNSTSSCTEGLNKESAGNLIESPDYHGFLLVKTVLGVVTAVLCLPSYASFWHYVLVIRQGLTAELNLVLVFIKHNEGRLDWCRRRIVEIHRELAVLRHVMAGLMPFIVASGVLGVTVHISWNYNVYSDNKRCLAEENLLINIFIFSEKFMVLILPLVAVGGLNVDHIWFQFMYALSRQKNTDHEEFWDRLLHFTKELDPEHNGMDITVLLSVVSLYLGRNLTGQQVNYFGVGA
ncbi:uncharacterized protein LOC110987393 [Acanthaster planci]|uniref:Uncharacterized protein LOC110987393 n=1 Tax=Acanthaster planci TaxID=133434 RepID=A0A8B7ZQR6_ACAPL|nr:uncharacterized protein LOC110987393 [Acanthaster planci]